MTAPVTDCRLDERREGLLATTEPLNGIDYVEVDPLDHTILRVTFLKPLPAGAYGIPADLRRVAIAVPPFFTNSAIFSSVAAGIRSTFGSTRI